MDNIVMPDGSGSSWTQGNGYALKLRFPQEEDPYQFYGRRLVPPPFGINHPFLRDQLNQFPGSMDETLRVILWLTHEITRVQTTREYLVDALAMKILEWTGSQFLGNVIVPHHLFSINVRHNSARRADTDLALVHMDTKLVIALVENKSEDSNDDPKVQLVAEALGAFKYNNNILRGLGLRERELFVFPCMTIMGARITFYKVPVTNELAHAVELGIPPSYPTVVIMYKIPKTEEGVEDIEEEFEEDMISPPYRGRVFQHTITFWHTILQLWNHQIQYYLTPPNPADGSWVVDINS